MPARPVCVTGASGFVGGWVVEEFLSHGVSVNATVRDPSAKKNNFLRELGDKYKSKATLTLFEGDLNKHGSFDAAIDGCDVVVHVAANVTPNYKKDPFAEIINPIIDGVKNVVESCKKNNVRRIVYTSSVAVLSCSENKRPLARRGKPFTEADDWSTHLSPTYGTYGFAKQEAEKLIFELWQGELIAIRPSWIMGPQQNPQITSSQQVLRGIANKENGRMVPLMYMDWVDVRDVAAAHYFAATEANIPTGKYNVTSCTVLSASDIAEAMNAVDPSLKVPTKMMPWGMLWVASWWDARISPQILNERTQKMSPIDHSKIKQVGFAFKHTDIVETMRATINSFKEFGILKSQ